MLSRFPLQTDYRFSSRQFEVSRRYVTQMWSMGSLNGPILRQKLRINKDFISDIAVDIVGPHNDQDMQILFHEVSFCHKKSLPPFLYLCFISIFCKTITKSQPCSNEITARCNARV